MFARLFSYWKQNYNLVFFVLVQYSKPKNKNLAIFESSHHEPDSYKNVIIHLQ
jgi:hypothetical protein